MGYSDGLITETNVSIKDVKDVLEASSYDLGTLCTYSKINCWSKKKPVRINSVAPDRTKDWWKGTAGNCGLNFTAYSSIANMVAAYDGDMNGWTYLKPQGGSTDPYRLADFCGYYHKASPILTEFKTAQEKVTKGKTLQIMGSLNTSGGYSLTLADIGGFSGGVLGVRIQSDSVTTAQTAESTSLTEMNLSVDTTTLNPATYKIYPFIRVDTKYYTIAKVNYITVQIQSAQEAVAITAGASSRISTRITYSFTIKNNGSTGISITSANARLRLPSNVDGTSLKTSERSVTIDAFTLAAGESVTKSGTFTVTSAALEDYENEGGWYTTLYLSDSSNKTYTAKQYYSYS